MVCNIGELQIFYEIHLGILYIIINRINKITIEQVDELHLKWYVFYPVVMLVG